MFALFATLDSGDEIIVPEPFYANYSSFCAMGNFKIIPITSTLENNFALPNIQAKYCTAGCCTRAYVILIRWDDGAKFS